MVVLKVTDCFTGGSRMKYTLGTKEVELSKMPGFYIVEFRDNKKVVSYSIENYFEAEDKFKELKKKLKETK